LADVSVNNQNRGFWVVAEATMRFAQTLILGWRLVTGQFISDLSDPSVRSKLDADLMICFAPWMKQEHSDLW
jgi:hypothetical protein